MNDWNVWRLIKAGFWIGIGFIIPSLVVYGLGAVLMVGLTPALMQFGMEQAEDVASEDGMLSAFESRFDKTSDIEILEYRETKHGDQLLILGEVKNIGTKTVSSIQLEAELFDSQKKFVFECSEYLSRRLKAGEIEHFQIRCGCRGKGVPDYESLSIRVVSASRY